MRESSGHEHLNGCLVIPVINEHGVITEVYGRKLLGKRLRKNCAQHLYLPGPHEGVWNIEAVVNSKEIILCESLIDAMTFWVNGYRNVTASYGTSGFTEDHVEAFKRGGVEKVLIAYDRDDAGNKAAELLAKALVKYGIDAYRVLFPKGMDANEYAQKVTPADKSLGLALRKAEWIANGKRPPKVEAREVLESSDDVEATEPSPSLAAEPLAAESRTEASSEVMDMSLELHDNGTDVTTRIEDRDYRIRGLHRNISPEQLKINLLVRYAERFYVDSLDLYASRPRQHYIQHAAREVGLEEATLKRDMGRLLLNLEAWQEAQQQQLKQKNAAPKLSDEELKAALEWLQSPSLLNDIIDDFGQLGVVGEESNKLVGYLAATSRKLEKPLAVMIQSSSAAGKSSLMEAVLSLMPEEERIQYSAMTGQSLFYMGDQDLKHKILAIAEEEGAENTSYALKLLQSEGEVSIASTGKNERTGDFETQTYRVEGPVMLFSTTTAIDIDEELMNRCLVLSVDESRAQTEAIHAQQRRKRTLEGLRAKHGQQRLRQRHQNAQRLLRPLSVLNPYADQLTFVSHQTRTRRDHEKYLTLIDTIALLHQYQREVKSEAVEGDTFEYIEVTLEDIAMANELAHEVLGRTLDELPPQTRKLLRSIDEMVTKVCDTENLRRQEVRFTRKDVRAFSGWGNTQLKIHMMRLEEMEYVLVHKGRRGQAMEYELLFEGEADGKRLLGLIDPKAMGYDAKWSGLMEKESGASRPQVGEVSVVGRTPKTIRNALQFVASSESKNEVNEPAHLHKNNGASHHSAAAEA